VVAFFDRAPITGIVTTLGRFLHAIILSGQRVRGRQRLPIPAPFLSGEEWFPDLEGSSSVAVGATCRHERRGRMLVAIRENESAAGTGAPWRSVARWRRWPAPSTCSSGRSRLTTTATYHGTEMVV
jgi:hypothetical protein